MSGNPLNPNLPKEWRLNVQTVKDKEGNPVSPGKVASWKPKVTPELEAIMRSVEQGKTPPVQGTRASTRLKGKGKKKSKKTRRLPRRR